METRSANPSRMDRDDEKKMLPCRFFVSGFCHKGNRCRFYHPQPAAMATMMVVPPLPPHFSTPPVLSPNNSRSAPYSVPNPSSARSNNMGSRRSGTRSESVLNANAAEFVDYGYHPPSPTYSEYDLAYNQPQSQYEQEVEAEEVQPQQNTVFNHIDWAQFLAPGYLPPPPILITVEEGSAATSPAKSTAIKTAKVLAMKNSINLKCSAENLENDDTPPEGRKPLEAKENASAIENGKLSAKLELQMKVQQIAKELADEPAQHVRNLDSYFRTYNFNALPLSNGSLLDEDDEENCENDPPEKEDDEDEKEEDSTPLSVNIDASECKENVLTPTPVN